MAGSPWRVGRAARWPFRVPEMRQTRPSGQSERPGGEAARLSRQQCLTPRHPATLEPISREELPMAATIAPTAHTMSLDEQEAFYEAQGYLVFPEMLGREEVALLRAALD